MNYISKFLASKLSGHLAWIQAAVLIGGAVWLFWQGYDLCKAGQVKATSDRQRAQVEGEINLSKDVENKKREISEDESSGLDIIYNAVERLH